MLLTQRSENKLRPRDAQGRGSGSSSSQQSARSWGLEPVANLAAGLQRGKPGHVQSPLS